LISVLLSFFIQHDPDDLILDIGPVGLVHIFRLCVPDMVCGEASLVIPKASTGNGFKSSAAIGLHDHRGL
jgi:hypothetical protein